MKHSTSTVKHTVIERRSIDYVPDNERFGSAMGQFTLWLGVNLNITAIVTGALAVVLGGDVFWSLIGLFIGQILGSIIMGLQAIQGPATGLPQMIRGNDSNLLIVFYVQIVPDDFVMQLHRF
ncbi:cytosine permease [Raoultella ornithinolytica]|nr:cytosine permease [Raoultella ornithinolytica]